MKYEEEIEIKVYYYYIVSSESEREREVFNLVILTWKRNLSACV